MRMVASEERAGSQDRGRSGRKGLKGTPIRFDLVFELTSFCHEFTKFHAKPNFSSCNLKLCFFQFLSGLLAALDDIYIYTHTQIKMNRSTF